MRPRDPPQVRSGSRRGSLQTFISLRQGGVGAAEGRVTVTKGHCAGDSAGLFLSSGHPPLAWPRGKNLSCDSASGASSSGPGFLASPGPLARHLGFLFVCLFSSQFPSFSLPGGLPDTRVDGERGAASEVYAPEYFHSALVRRSPVRAAVGFWRARRV